jgi:hypothetical protein
MSDVQYLMLDSRNRISGTEGRAVFQFEQSILLPAGAELYIAQFVLPMTHYTVITGVNDIIPSDLGDTTLTQGVYTITSLLAHIETAMSTATSTTITCSVSNYTVTIASTGTPTLAWTDSTHTAARLLGWDPATDVAAGASHTAPNPYDLSRPHFLHMDLEEISAVSIFIPGTPQRLTHFSIPVTCATGDVLEYWPTGMIIQPIRVTRATPLKRLTVWVRDEENHDIVRGDWTLLLRVRTP